MLLLLPNNLRRLKPLPGPAAADDSDCFGTIDDEIEARASGAEALRTGCGGWRLGDSGRDDVEAGFRSSA